MFLVGLVVASALKVRQADLETGRDDVWGIPSFLARSLVEHDPAFTLFAARGRFLESRPGLEFRRRTAVALKNSSSAGHFKFV